MASRPRKGKGKTGFNALEIAEAGRRICRWRARSTWSASVSERRSARVASRMAALHGSLDSSHSPLVTIAVSAPSGPSHFVDALVDTGFTGFVQLPEQQARALGLALRAVSEAQYADGRTATIPLAWAKVTLGPDTQEGFAHIQTGSDEVIVGVELLREEKVEGGHVAGTERRLLRRPLAEYHRAARAVFERVKVGLHDPELRDARQRDPR